MPRRTSLIICVFPSLEHSTWCVHKLQTILGLLCVPLVGTQTTDGEMPSLCQTKHNRANRNSLSSAIENKADDNSDIGFARLCCVQWCQQGAHTKVLKLSADCGHPPWNVPNLEKHRSSRMFDAAWLEKPDFAIRMSLPAVFWNFVFSDISIIKHRPFRLQKSGSYFWERVHAG